MSRYLLILIVIALSLNTHAQHIFKGKIIDAVTKDPIQGASIQCTKEGCRCGCLTTTNGEFEMRCQDCSTIKVSFIGYDPIEIAVVTQDVTAALSPSSSLMNTVVVSAGRGETIRRSEAPIAIATLSNKLIQDAKAISIDQVLNKVSGVNMINLGNEQHQMSIRQPMSTKSLFLYLEDGIPIRTTGLFNHNALLEMNMAAAKSIEVIKGPSSSLYGSEAIGGVVNFISTAPSVQPLLKLSIQGNNIGYKRTDFQSSFTEGKCGFALNGYYANKQDSYLEFTDYHKGILTGRVDYRFSDKTKLTNSITYLNYFSDMPGGVDSIMYATRSFVNPQTFTYRKVTTLRYHSMLTQDWNDQSKTSLTALYRDNAIGQNPNYRIKDDYKKTNGIWAGQKDLAHGEINASSFQSYSIIAQHKQNLNWKKATLTGGASADLSPSLYRAQYIRISKDTITRKYISYQETDSLLTHYHTDLNNYAAFASFAFSPVAKLRLVASLRYDFFHYVFRNSLKPSAFSGSADTVNNFKRLSPKVGFTYNFSARTGIYANYSQGFVPPQVSELYTGVKVPYLNSSVFYNYELGGWAELIKNRLTADVSLYDLQGNNEVVSVKLDDGSYQNQNAGITSHRGIEFGINANAARDLTMRVSGAYSEHRFINFIEKGISYNGHEMNNAPRWLGNAEIWYKPSFAKGLRIGAEVQQVGGYYTDPQNTTNYQGYTVLNLRTGYTFKGLDIWINVLNATNAYYSYITTKSSSGWSYQLAEPLNINAGVAYNFNELLKNKNR